MPPKNKKQLQEQAKRLEQQQRKKEEQQRRLEQQRKKYASQTLNTDLILPVSNQLIADFFTENSSFINEKLTEVLVKLYSELKDTRILKHLLKQLLYVIKNTTKLFTKDQNYKKQINEQNKLKIRVVCGLFLQVFLNGHSVLSKQNIKNKQNDQGLLKQLILSHSQNKTEKQKKVFNKEEIIEILKYFKESYFNHFLILHKFSNFAKRQDQKSFTIYIDAPTVEFNTAQTNFIDLSNRNNNQGENQNQDKKSDLHTQ